MGKWQRAKYQPNLPLGENGSWVTASQEHIKLSKEAAREGMVLLKNEDCLLPLSLESRLALFGKGTFDYVKGGGGSGDVMVSYSTDLYEGIKQTSGAVQIFEELAGFYRDSVNMQYRQGIEPGMIKEPLLDEELCKRAASFADTAIITISRFSGEGWDRRSSYDSAYMKKDSGSIFEDGDFYLTHAEKAMVAAVKKYFTRIVVVMNVGGMVDTSWFKEDSCIQGALMAWQGGIEGGRAAAELLFGIENPSGKLADTFAKTLEDYPSTKGFHEAVDFVDYLEDIYVGYRYFETIPGAYERVNYEFGFGLSYTSFEYSLLSVREVAADTYIEVEVKNIGSVPGREVIQLYAELPQGLLGKPARTLAAFKKTARLNPGEEQRIILSFRINDLSSYDDLGKIQKAAFILEQGEYVFYLGTSVRACTRIDYTYSVRENRVVEQLTSLMTPSSLMCRMQSDGSFEKLPLTKPNDPNATELEKGDWSAKDEVNPSVRAISNFNRKGPQYRVDIKPFGDVAEGKLTLEQFMEQLSDEELAHLLGGQPNIGVSETFGIGCMPDLGVPEIMTADGPAGLRTIRDSGVKTTAFPCATALACTWEPELAYQIGKAGAKEVKENNIGVWLTPAVNIHRSPLCGRNFEYYSEDPFLTGRMASAMVMGIQSQNIAATVKHFACNNKETNRKESDSRVSERAVREIYLRAFRIIVEQAKPWCIMSSYNIINGHRASENRDMLTGVLRDEWHYEGLVMSDWWTHGEPYKEVSAGNNLKMPSGVPERLMQARDCGLLTRDELIYSARKVLELILKID